MVKKNYFKLILSIVILFSTAIIAAISLNAAVPDVDFNQTAELRWFEISAEEEYFSLGVDEIYGTQSTIPAIAEYTNPTDMRYFVAYNGVNAIYENHTEAYLYWVFDGVNEVVDFYNYKFHKKETVAYADLVDVQVDVNPNSDYENGYNTARDNFAVNIDGEWVSAVDYGVVKFDEAKTEYGIHYNNEWLTAINYANIISNQSFDDGYDLGVEASYYLDRHMLYRDLFGIDYLPKLIVENDDSFLDDEIYYLVPLKKYSINGRNSKDLLLGENSYYFDIDFNLIDDQTINIATSRDVILDVSSSFRIKNTIIEKGKYEIFYNYTIESWGGAPKDFYKINFKNILTDSLNSFQYMTEYGHNYSYYDVEWFFNDLDYHQISFKYENKNYYHKAFLYGDKVIPPIPPIKDGYKFVGWYAEDEDVAYDFNQELENDLILYAMYGLSVNVNFETNGGNEIDPLEVLSGQPLNIDDPIKDGYNFVGWYKDIELTEVLDVIPEVDLTVYAKWELKEHTITFNYNNEVYSTSIYDVENELIIPDDPEEIEISETLIWYYDEEFENRFNTTDIIIEDLNLYGKIETINFNIKFKVDDEIYESIIYLKGSDLILPATPTKEELVFLGWYYDEEFENKFSLEDEIVEDIILYGKFSSGSGGGSIDDSDETKFKTEYIGYAALVLVGLVVVIGLVKAPKKRKKR